MMIDKENKMRGSIRFIVGLLITFGAVGTLDFDMDADVILQTALAMIGLALMYSGAVALKTR